MQSHYDAIIIGDSLAARIAGVMLARAGCRVLSLNEGQATSPAWFASSYHLERLLETLNGRACLTPAAPFQFLAQNVQVDFSGRHPLDEELLREFPADGPRLLELLATLQQRGEHLERVLFKAEGAPLRGLGGSVRFRWQALRDNLRTGKLAKKLSRQVGELPLGDDSRNFIAALFSGLALTPYPQLSVAEAALLWNSHAREHGVSASGLDTLLQQRYEQFHGLNGEIESFRQCDATTHEIRQVSFKNGGVSTADHYLIASPDQLHRLAPSLRPESLNLPAAPLRAVTSELQGEPSPLLSRRVILAGDPTLRLCFGKRGERTLCALDLPASRELPSPETFHERLASVLPFCTFDLELPVPPPQATSGPPRATFLGQSASVRLLRNALFCHGASILPSLGSSGEVLLGVTVARHVIARRHKK